MSCDVGHSICPYTEEDKETLRRELDLKESIIQESIDSIIEWFQKQPHLAASGTINREIVERMLLIAKGSIEKTKRRINGWYKYRALSPELIQGRDTMLDSDKAIWTFFTHSVIPRLYNGKRVTVVTYTDPDPNAFLLDVVLKMSLMLLDLRLRYDYAISDIWIMDFRHVRLGHAFRLHPLTIRKASLILHEGIGMGIHGVHILNCSLASKLQVLINFFEQYANPKIMQRLVIHERVEDIYKYIPKEYLPRDIGGDQPSYEEFKVRYEKEIRSPKTKQLLVEMSTMVSQETLRPGGGHGDHFLPGSFKQLEFD